MSMLTRRDAVLKTYAKEYDSEVECVFAKLEVRLEDVCNEGVSGMAQRSLWRNVRRISLSGTLETAGLDFP